VRNIISYVIYIPLNTVQICLSIFASSTLSILNNNAKMKFTLYLKDKITITFRNLILNITGDLCA
jgi:hypothetical protein